MRLYLMFVTAVCVLFSDQTEMAKEKEYFKHNFAKKIRSPKSTLVIEKKLVVCSLILTKNLTKSNVAKLQRH